MAKSSVALLIGGPLVVAALWLVLGVALRPGAPDLGGTVVVTYPAAPSSPRAAEPGPETTTGTDPHAAWGSARVGTPTSITAATAAGSTGAAGAPSTRPTPATGAPVTSLLPGATARPTEPAASTRAMGTAPSPPGSPSGGAAAVTMAAGVCPAGDNSLHDDGDDGDLGDDDDPDDECDD